MTAEFTTIPDTLTQTHQHQFSCRQCGSAVAYHIGSDQLRCLSCGHQETITLPTQGIVEKPLKEALAKIQFSSLPLKTLEPPNTVVTCNNCGAESQWDIYSLSDLCPYCKTPIAKCDTDKQRLQIEAIVPFDIEQSQAFKHFSQWIQKRWFAPNVLKEMAGHSKTFQGIYIPHWTFDSLTQTDYTGQRGEYYIEYVRQQRIVNGKSQSVDVPVTRTRWFPARGRVRLLFDDILVLASVLIPRKIINQLRPWQLQSAQPYTPEYVAGLQAKYYQIDLDDAFTIAKQQMENDINRAIRYDIGGDTQRIHSAQTQHQNSTYKLLLLPVWYSAFEYKGKKYETVVNGQTGKVSGQYPKSVSKITAAIITAAIGISIAAYFIYKNQYTPY